MSLPWILTAFFYTSSGIFYSVIMSPDYQLKTWTKSILVLIWFPIMVFGLIEYVIYDVIPYLMSRWTVIKIQLAVNENKNLRKERDELKRDKR